MLYGFLVLFLLLAGLPPVMAATHVAIHATDVEVGIWQTRAVSGPYKSDWDVLKARADRFVASPPARWAGNTTSTCYNGNAFSYGISRTQDMGLRDAAFVYFVQGGTSYLNAARTALLAQTTVTGTKFENGARWCTSAADATNTGLGNTIGAWVRRLAYAYSYIKPALSTADQTKLNTWFTNAGMYFYSVNHTLVAKRFPQRLHDIYTPIPAAGSVRGLTHFGGYTVYSFMDAWSNEGTGVNAVVAVIGCLVNHATMKSHAARFIQEWIKYGTFAGGQSLEQARWQFGATSGTPQHGYLYAGHTIGSALTAIDVLARDGYVNLFDYSTSVGLHGSEGGPKSILNILQHYAALTNGTVIEYASKTATSDPNLRIDPVGPGQTRIEYLNLAHGNLYHQDPAVITAYTKATPGSISTVGCDMLGGDWCTLPGVRFMYGGLEGVSRPYGGLAAPVPDYTSNLTMHLALNEGTLTTAQDSTANNHDGTLSAGATWGPAKMGASAVVLDGTANGIVTVTGELGTPAAVTLATWVKVSAFPTPTADVISIGDSVILRATATTVRGDYYTGTTWSNLSATRTLGTTDWHHLAFVVQAGTQQLYLDGAPVASGSNGAPIVYAGLGSNTILGGHGDGNVTNFRFQGTLDDVRVYSRALSATDIAGLAGLEGVP